MKCCYLLLGIIILVSVTVLTAQAQQSPWPMFRHDDHHTGRTNYTGPATPTVYWTFQANDGIASSPSIGHNGTIYIGAGGYYGGGGDSSLYAINPDGSLKWQFKTDRSGPPADAAGIFSSPAIGANGVIYVGSLDGHLYAIEDSITYGNLKWKTSFGNMPVYSSPAVKVNGTIYVGSLNFNFYALDPEGTVIWTYPTNWCVFSSPAFGPDGIVYVGSKDHHLYAFRDSIGTGALEWSYPTGVFYDGHLVDCSPAVGEDGTIYFGTDPYGAWGQTPVPVDTVFFAVNPDGTLKWIFVMGDGAESSPAIGPDGTIYVGSYDSCVYAIEDMGTEGLLKWKFVTGGPVDASPTVDGDGTIYIGSNDSTLYALNPDGTVKWTFLTEGKIESSVTIDGHGYLYFGSFDGKLYALGSGAPDVGAVSVDMPDSVRISSNYAPAATFRNYRASHMSFEASCTIEGNGDQVYANTIEIVDILDGQAQQELFDAWMVGPDSSVTYTITVVTLLSGDDNFGNDTAISQVYSVPEVAFICGDVDSDGSGPNVADVIYLVDYLFFAGQSPPFLDAADVDASERINVVDLIYIVDYLFWGGPEPQCP